MSLQDPPRSEVEELREIVEKAKLVIPRYLEQNAALKKAIQEKEIELEKYKNLYAKKLTELKEYETLYNEAKNSVDSYKVECKDQRKKIVHLYLAFTFVLLLVFAYLFVFPFGSPADDIVQIKPTSTPVAASARSVVQVQHPVNTSSSSVQESKKDEIYVWIPQHGKRYHDAQGCSGMNDPHYVSISEAKRRGYTPCGTCKPPR